MAVVKTIKENVKKPSKNSIKKSWQTVKIKGNVISDDSAAGLEGLIGLEVLEKYDKSLVLKDRKKRKFQKPEKIEGKRNRDKSSDSEASGDEEGGKKPKKKKKSENKKKTEQEQYPGRFVLLKPPQNPTTVTEKTSKKEPPKNGAQKEGLDIDDLMGWNGLGVPDSVLKAIAENGFKSPTQIQSLTLPPAIMGKKDILGAAETGSGKTLAFGIPIITGILELKKKNLTTGIRKLPKTAKKEPTGDERENCTPPPEELDDVPDIEDLVKKQNKKNKKKKPLYALILTPTRELAVQVKDHLVSVARYTGINVAAIFGGLAAVKQERVLRQCPEIIVATPGRLWELLELGNPHLEKMDDISFLVIDETDRMVEKGHFEELRMLLKRLNADESKKGKRQNFVFSATLTLVHDIPDHLKKKNVTRNSKFVKPTSEMKIQNLIEELGISQPKIVDITRSNQTAQTLMESRIVCPIDHKDYYLYYFIQKHPGRTIVFCNSIDCVKRLAQLFSILECRPLPLHANMNQKQRLKNLERFRDNPNGFLIATDVAARGLDIPNVQHVIHYQVPRTSENYVHRSGRTARANKDGITIMLMEPGEVKNYLKLCKTLDRTEDLPIFPVAERFLRAVKERVNIARDVDILDLKFRRTQSEIGWWKKNSEEMELVLDEDMDMDKSDDDDDNPAVMETRRNKGLLQARRQQLRALLDKPLFPSGFTYRYPTSSGKLEIPLIDPDANERNSAVNVMKEAIEENRLVKKKKNKKKAVKQE